MFIVYGGLALIALFAFIGFVFGRFIGGVLDDASAHVAEIKKPELRHTAIKAITTAPAHIWQRIGRAMNHFGDNLQRMTGTVIVVVGLIAAAFAIMSVNKTGQELFILVVSGLAAGGMLFYLSASEAQRTERALLVSKVITGGVIVVLFVDVLIDNSRIPLPVNVVQFSVPDEDGTISTTKPVQEWFIETPAGTVLSAQEVLGMGFEDHIIKLLAKDPVGQAKDARLLSHQGTKFAGKELWTLVDCDKLSLAVGGYKLFQNGDVCSMRVNPWALPRKTLAIGEYKNAEDIPIRRKAEAVARKETKAALDRREKNIGVATPVSTSNAKIHSMDPEHQGFVFVGILLCIAIAVAFAWPRTDDAHKNVTVGGVIRLVKSEPKPEVKPASPAAAPSAAPKEH